MKKLINKYDFKNEKDQKKLIIIMKKICKELGIKLHFVKKKDRWCKGNGEFMYSKTSWVSGNEIWVGMYEDFEIKVISFFHELGHILCYTQYGLNRNDCNYEEEHSAWGKGIASAFLYDIYFSKKIDSYIGNCLRSHLKIENLYWGEENKDNVKSKAMKFQKNLDKKVSLLFEKRRELKKEQDKIKKEKND